MPLDSAFLGQINRAVGVIGLVVGLAFILGGGFFIHHNHLDEFMLHSAVAEAEVVENRAKQVYPGTGSSTLPYTSYEPIVRFTDQQGQTVTYADKCGISRPAFVVGQQVSIFYVPQGPEHAII